MSNEKKDYFWKVAVVVVLAVLCVQSFFTYRIITNKNQKVEKKIVNESETLKLLPRKINAYQNTTQNIKQQLKPRPLPRLNLNLNQLPGVKPSVTVTQPPQQPQQNKFCCQPPPPTQPRLRVGFNNSPDPFDMNIREEIARMEEMMNAMFSGPGGLSSFAGSMNIPSPRNSFRRNATPSVSLDKDQNYIVQLQIPGLDKSEIKAEVTGNILTVSGVQREEQTSSANGGQSYLSSYSSFQNSFSLPGPAKSQGLKMDYKGNTLTIKIPRA